MRRSKLLPEGGEDVDLSVLADEVKRAVSRARRIGRMQRDLAATRLWREMYPKLSG